MKFFIKGKERMHLLSKVSLIVIFSLLFVGCSLDNNKVVSKPVKIKYKYCNKHIKTMKFASNYILKEFDEGYLIKKDILGAKAQLFLIENNSPSPFAKNINRAKDSYNLHFKIAKKNNCDLKGFDIHPLEKVKNSIKILEKRDEK